MDNIRFGSFVAQLRKEQGADPEGAGPAAPRDGQGRLKMGDRTGISRPEAAGAPGPDPGGLSGGAAPGERTSSPTLSVEEAGQVAARAMDQYQQTTVLRYLRLFRWVCTAAAVFCFLFLLPYLVYGVSQLYFHWVIEPQMGSSAARRAPPLSSLPRLPCSPPGSGRHCWPSCAPPAAYWFSGSTAWRGG